MNNTIISEIDSKIEATVKLLKSLDFVHSILLFGSISKVYIRKRISEEGKVQKRTLRQVG